MNCDKCGYNFDRYSHPDEDTQITYCPGCGTKVNVVVPSGSKKAVEEFLKPKRQRLLD